MKDPISQPKGECVRSRNGSAQNLFFQHFSRRSSCRFEVWIQFNQIQTKLSNCTKWKQMKGKRLILLPVLVPQPSPWQAGGDAWPVRRSWSYRVNHWSLIKMILFVEDKPTDVRAVKKYEVYSSHCEPNSSKQKSLVINSILNSIILFIITWRLLGAFWQCSHRWARCWFLEQCGNPPAQVEELRLLADQTFGWSILTHESYIQDDLHQSLTPWDLSKAFRNLVWNNLSLNMFTWECLLDTCYWKCVIVHQGMSIGYMLLEMCYCSPGNV